MTDFLKQNKAEVIKMSIYEYDEEKYKKLWRQEGIEEGIEKGRSIERRNTKRAQNRANREKARADAAISELNEVKAELARLKKDK